MMESEELLKNHTLLIEYTFSSTEYEPARFGCVLSNKKRGNM